VPAKKKPGHRAASPVIVARLGAHVALEAQADGNVIARFDQDVQGLGRFAPAISQRIGELRAGIPLAAVERRRAADKDIALLVKRLAQTGLLEYRLGVKGRQDIVVIEPQTQDYWPRISKISNSDSLVLSRFAYLRRRGRDMVLESPLAGALFRIANPRIAAALTVLSRPQKISRYRKEPDFPGLELLGLLLDCQILFKLQAGDTDGTRRSEGGRHLVLWDFHDLLFHTRSTEGRQANPLGGLYGYAGAMPPLPAVRSPWPGKAIDLVAETTPQPSQFAQLLYGRHSTRDFDDAHPVTLAELATLLQTAARIRDKWTESSDLGDQGPDVSYAARPYPSGGAAYPLEIYLAVNQCDGLASGFYHYDAERHALTAIDVRPQDLDAQLESAAYAIGADSQPQIVFVIAARFGRVSWKYSAVAYSLILKDVGVVMQTLYLAATDLGLGCCAVGTNNIELFGRMTRQDFTVEGPVGQFVLGRARQQPADNQPGPSPSA
jgi:SagB-type dehydrogenase family enzyme